MITDRDYTIFDILADGPVTMLILHKLLTDRKEPVTMNALKVRMSALKKYNLVQTRRYHNRAGMGVFSLYSLTPLSAHEMVLKGYNPTNIRFNLPNEYLVTHELTVTDVVRTIRKEARLFDFEVQLTDERILREEAQGRGKKKLPTPDLLLRLAYRVQGKHVAKQLHVEIDNATIPVKVIIEKIETVSREFALPTIMICPVRARITNLIRAFADRPHLHGMIFFAELYDFVAQGLLGVSWQLANGHRVNLMPKDADIKRRYS